MRWLIFSVSSLPFVIILLGILELYPMGPNIVESVLHRSGNTSLNLLMIIIAIPLVAKLAPLRLLILFRRMLGLFAFFYTTTHLMVYVFIDRTFSILSFTSDFYERPYIIAGLSAFLMLIPMAVTSTRLAQLKLGIKWKKIHRLIYPSLFAALIHFIWQMKADESKPMIYIVGFTLLVLMKFHKKKTNHSS
jgi:sulfoxide reductase heme-binding subunit YedZ